MRPRGHDGPGSRRSLDKKKVAFRPRYVQRFGLRLLPEIYSAYNPMSYDAERYVEVELAIVKTAM